VRGACRPGAEDVSRIRQIDADHAVLVERKAIVTEHAGDDERQTGEKEGSGSLCMFARPRAGIGDVDWRIENAAPKTGLPQLLDQHLLDVEHLGSGMVTGQGETLAVPCEVFYGASEGIDAARKKRDLVGREMGVRETREIELLFGERFRSLNEGKRIGVVRKKAEGSSERFLDRSAFP
jgi:hypothetical protein